MCFHELTGHHLGFCSNHKKDKLPKVPFGLNISVMLLAQSYKQTLRTIWLQVVIDRHTDRQTNRETDRRTYLILSPLFCYAGMVILVNKKNIR